MDPARLEPAARDVEKYFLKKKPIACILKCKIELGQPVLLLVVCVLTRQEK